MGTKYVIRSLVLFATIAYVHGFVCPIGTCAMVECNGTTPSSCEAKGQVLMPYAGYCGCCPACVERISKGGKCASFLQLLSEPERAGCETGTVCKKVADNTFVCD